MSLDFPAHADLQKTKIAVFSQKEAAFSETITLYSDGKYKQIEQQTAALPYHLSSSRTVTMPEHIRTGGTRGGVWHLLDKEDGTELVVKPGAKIPDTAYVELKGAMPFGFVWENQSPELMHSNRTLPAKSFQFTLPSSQATSTSVITLGSPLPEVAK